MSLLIQIGKGYISPEEPNITSVVWEQSVLAPQCPNDKGTQSENHRGLHSGRWEDFCKSVKLTDAFFGEGGINPHRDFNVEVPITEHMVDTFERALTEYEAKRARVHRLGSKPAGYGDGYDDDYARLQWLCFWTRYALESYGPDAVFTWGE